MPRVAVVVPWRGGCPARQRAWDWVRAQHAAEHPDWTVAEALAPPGPWVKAAAAMPAVAACDADVIVLSDADVWTPAHALEEAVREVLTGAPWAIPHFLVHRLTETATADVLAGAAWEQQPTIERPYPGIEAGGLLVITREVLEAVPLDHRFVGWGQEDESHAIALRCLLGPPWRGVAPLVHLFHPPQPRVSRRRGSVESWQLRRRYLKARSDPAAMRRLLQEAADALPAPEPGLHDHAAL